MKNEAKKSLLAIPISFSLYYLITGLWPILDIQSFLYVTGPKTDIWLVKTVGVLIAVIGLVILTATLRKKIQIELGLLAIGAAAGLTFVDCYYVFNHIISPVYLLDAGAEVVFIVLWILFLLKRTDIS